MTPRQQQVLFWLIEQTLINLYQPTNREAAAHFGWSSTNCLPDYLRVWVKGGYVVSRKDDTHARGQMRCIRFTAKAWKAYVEYDSEWAEMVMRDA